MKTATFAIFARIFAALFPAVAAVLFAVAAALPAEAQTATGNDAALISVAQAGNLAEVNRLIAAGADVDAVDDDGNTALMGAAVGGHSEVAKALIAAGVDVNAATAEGNTALDAAKEKGHTKIVQILKSAGAKKTGTTATRVVNLSADCKELLDDSGVFADGHEKLRDDILQVLASPKSAVIGCRNEVSLQGGNPLQTCAVFLSSQSHKGEKMTDEKQRLMDCPDCGKQVAVRSAACIHCGSDFSVAGYKFRREHEYAQRDLAWEESRLRAILTSGRWRYVFYFLFGIYFPWLAFGEGEVGLALGLLAFACVAAFFIGWGRRKKRGGWYFAYFLATLIVPPLIVSAFSKSLGNIGSFVVWGVLAASFVTFFVSREKEIRKEQAANEADVLEKKILKRRKEQAAADDG